MVEQNMIGNRSNNLKIVVYEDESDFKTVGVVVDDVAYDTGSFLDRDYDVRGFKGFSIALENIGANSVDYTILGATKSFTLNGLDADLDDADFSEILQAEAAIAAAGKATFKLVRETEEITAIRVRAKETVGGSSGTLRGDVQVK